MEGSDEDVVTEQPVIMAPYSEALTPPPQQPPPQQPPPQQPPPQQPPPPPPPPPPPAALRELTGSEVGNEAVGKEAAAAKEAVDPSRLKLLHTGSVSSRRRRSTREGRRLRPRSRRRAVSRRARS